MIAVVFMIDIPYAAGLNVSFIDHSCARQQPCRRFRRQSIILSSDEAGRQPLPIRE
jgi:hypothetical protein